MDAGFILHLIFIIFFLSIPFWKLQYLRYGVYTPIILASIWIIFNGCPLTQIQKDLNDEYFSRVLFLVFISLLRKRKNFCSIHSALLLFCFWFTYLSLATFFITTITTSFLSCP